MLMQIKHGINDTGDCISNWLEYRSVDSISSDYLKFNIDSNVKRN